MEEKNRFSILLEQLMLMAELKNYTLAQNLQYDVSYISKWVSGKMLPSEKCSKEVMKRISHCVVDALDEKTLHNLYEDYSVYQSDELKVAIYDKLVSEYNYVKGLKKTYGSEIAPKVSFFSEMTLPQFVKQMKHPALRNVKSLDVVSIMDILTIEREYRLAIAQIENTQLIIDRDYPAVHFSMLINLEIGERDYVYDTVFIVNMLTNFTHIDFQIYGAKEAYGKIVFATKNEYAISGMLLDSKHCMAVTVCEEPKDANVLYHQVKSLCNREMLLFRRATMIDLIRHHDYIQSMLSTNIQWLLSHMTEHFLPDDLFEEALEQSYTEDEWTIGKEEMRKTHLLTKNILEESAICIMLYENALTDFVVSGELDFYNHKVHLSANQRLRYIKNVIALMDKNDTMQVKLIYGRFVTDFQYGANPCIFLSDVTCYLRLNNEYYHNNIEVLNGITIKELFRKFYHEVWNEHKEVVIEDKWIVCDKLRHILQSIELIDRME